MRTFLFILFLLFSNYVYAKLTYSEFFGVDYFSSLGNKFVNYYDFEDRKEAYFLWSMKIENFSIKEVRGRFLLLVDDSPNRVFVLLLSLNWAVSLNQLKDWIWDINVSNCPSIFGFEFQFMNRFLFRQTDHFCLLRRLNWTSLLLKVHLKLDMRDFFSFIVSYGRPIGA